MTPRRRTNNSSTAGIDTTKIIFLGGLGEIGRNMTLFEHGGKILVIDVGLMFPTEEMLGVDLVLPDFTYLKERRDQVVGVLLTHAHEDHIGGLAYLLKEMNVPAIYGAKLTLGILRAKLDEHRVLDKAKLVEVAAPGKLSLGPFDLRFFNMVHSIPDCLGTHITTPAGTIFYTSDYKLDPYPIGDRPTDLEGIGEVAAHGIDLFLGDSTNADHPGHTPSERTVGEPIHDVIRSAKGRVIVACFASNIHRVQQVLTAAEAEGKVVAFLGRSMLNNMRVAQELGYVKVPDWMVVPIDQIGQYPEDKVVIISTGSQGEPLSALSLMSAREHKWVQLHKGDSVVLSATPIPGNESAVRRVIDGLFRIGAKVIAPPLNKVHVSGHASAEDLKHMLELVGPNWFVPVHGEYHHLALHAELAHQVGIQPDHVIVMEDGNVLEMTDGVVKKSEQHVEAGFVFVDGLGIGDVGDEVLRDRRVLADEGVVVCVVTIDSYNGDLLAGPDVISRGFVFGDESSEFLEEARQVVRDGLHNLADDEISDYTAVRRKVRKSLGSFVWKRTGRRPIILPIVMEV
ncbi:MAG TPA: ribonuclease J [Actinomycetota bacterium]|nr:ribonuclease J [Actinomycetota bacterium]